ncbi:hypothetical protein CEXT_418911 [Caerostris extrusa]|uniref:Uncharacterized protein n=1 Tax=Caerostris extrusa TaxID=172846 RepID=A0AAV4P414_CAEEX|nr:hypothetical protein CEXT_418911 [Caerostris extrusa]
MPERVLKQFKRISGGAIPFQGRAGKRKNQSNFSKQEGKKKKAGRGGNKSKEERKKVNGTSGGCSSSSSSTPCRFNSRNPNMISCGSGY